ncbi:ankyrin-repeat protein [Murmansk poxvirus]|uniref:Ankyrin-repeat protein n=1 Tax=Murmansk poxvirus TaxID=2025359 RepID=A0A223FMD6_9POXV|nr:ankyrin-repeat protein [Murmansk poxvirus]AST09204.1 ankyrin-repeat protein [Murmansk poxvirus]
MMMDEILQIIYGEIPADSFLAGIFDLLTTDVENNICHLYFSFFDVEPSSRLFKLIIKHCDLNKKLNCGTTPLHCYLRNNDFKTSVLKQLLEYGMNTFDVQDKNGHIPLHDYLTHRKVDDYIFNILSDNIESFSKYDLLPYYIESNNDNDLNYYVLYKLLKKGSDPNYIDNKGNNSLHHYCYHLTKCYKKIQMERGEKRFIKELVKYGANVNKVNNKGNTPLHIYMSKSKNRHSSLVINTLLSLGADLRICNRDHNTPIMEYMKCNNVMYNILIMLINCYESKYGNIQKEDGHKLLYTFIKHDTYNDINVLSYLLKKFNIKNNEYYNNMTLIHNACQCCNISVLSYLVYIGWDINILTKDNKTVFDIALEQSNDKEFIIYHLIKHGLDITLSVINKLINAIPKFIYTSNIQRIIAYSILRNEKFIEIYKEQCLNHNYRDLFVYFITFDYIDNIVSDCINDINILKEENVYNVLRYEDIKHYNLIKNAYMNKKVSVPVYKYMIDNYYLHITRKIKLINDVLDKLHSIYTNKKNRLSILPLEILVEIISKLSDYNLNFILYGNDYMKYYYSY